MGDIDVEVDCVVNGDCKSVSNGLFKYLVISFCHWCLALSLIITTSFTYDSEEA